MDTTGFIQNGLGQILFFVICPDLGALCTYDSVHPTRVTREYSLVSRDFFTASYGCVSLQ